MKNNNIRILFGLLLILFVAIVLLAITLFSVISRRAKDKEQALPMPITQTHKPITQMHRPVVSHSDEQPQPVSQTMPAPIKSDPQKLHVYLHSIKDILSRDGQPIVSHQQIDCPDHIKSYKTWPKICSEITFADQTKSIIWVTKERGLVAREDFDAAGEPISVKEYSTAGGYYDADKQINIPPHPAAPTLGIVYNAKVPAEHMPSKENAESFKKLQSDFTPAVLNEDIPINDEKHTRGPQYCDFYSKECRAD